MLYVATYIFIMCLVFFQQFVNTERCVSLLVLWIKFTHLLVVSMTDAPRRKEMLFSSNCK